MVIMTRLWTKKNWFQNLFHARTCSCDVKTCDNKDEILEKKHFHIDQQASMTIFPLRRLRVTP